MAEGDPPRIEWRVIDEDTGAEVIRRLSHPHKSTPTTSAILVGVPSQTSIPRCSIPLHAPGTDQWANVLESYLLLRQGQKLEGFLGPDTSGTPDYSFVIDDVRHETGGWSIEALGTLEWLQKSHMVPGEILASPVSGILPTDGLQVVRALSTTLERVWADDFSGWAGGPGPHPSSDYTQSGWSFTSADPYKGLPALTSTNTAIDAYVMTNTAWNNLGQYWAGVVTITGTVKPGTAASPNNSGDMSIILLGDTGWTQGILLRAGVIYNGSTWDVQIDANSKAGGAYTGRAGPVTNVLQGVRSPMPFQLKVPIFMNAGRHTIGCWINGTDSGLYVTDGGWFPASGGIGMRFVPTAGGSPQIWVNRIEFHARAVPGVWGTMRFANGSQSASPASAAIYQELPTNEQDFLSLIQMVAGVDNYQVRVTPGRGPKADAIDYGPILGRDLTNKLILREGVELKHGSLSASEPFGADLRMTAVPGTDTGGFITWSEIGASGSMVLEGQTADVGQPGFQFLVGWAQAVQARKANPLRSLTLRVVRTPEIAALQLRECDTVMVDYPSLGWNLTAATIVSVSQDERAANMEIVCNDLPRAARVAVTRYAQWQDIVGRMFKTR